MYGDYVGCVPSKFISPKFMLLFAEQDIDKILRMSNTVPAFVLSRPRYFDSDC